MNLKRIFKRIFDAQEFELVSKNGSFAVVYPGEVVRYWINKRGAQWVCTCPGFKYRGTCKHVQALKELGTDIEPKHGTAARVVQLEKSLKIWQARYDEDPSKKNQTMLEKRQKELEEAQKKLEEELKNPQPKRHPREQFEKFLPEVEEIFKGFSKWEIVGSWRRGSKDYKDIDVIVVASQSEFSKIYERLIEDENYQEIMHGPDLIRGYYHGEMFDVSRVPDPKEWGAFLMYRTGSKDFNVAVRGKLKSFGWGLSERGLLDENKTVVASETEEDIFEQMGIPYIEPKNRDKGKFEKIIKDINPRH